MNVQRRAYAGSDIWKDARTFERNVLHRALEKYRPGQSDPILVGGKKVFKPALRLMIDYRLR